ncbi:hypothetical protein F0562_001152 [Nyssa sinensis]|uniref:Exocyst subunit Exo70 family protein n=1 Tax=Nyssa sinensis TaxID=561372 RepID=A0A5J5C2E4_9ASTE|nr:hypothetical protein F0562_001152 [Nyssa sinensis]
MIGGAEVVEEETGTEEIKVKQDHSTTIFGTSMAENGEEKLVAVARHIAKTLGQTDNMADDILQIFSNFDGRLREKLSEKLGDEDPRGCASLEHTLKSLERQITRYVAADRPIWSDSADASSFLDAVDELLGTIRDWTPMSSEKPVATCLGRADDLLQQAMFRLEDEFKSLMERGGQSFDLTSYQNGEPAANYSFDSDEEDEDEDGEMIGGGEDHQIPVAHPISDYDIISRRPPVGDDQRSARDREANGGGRLRKGVFARVQ